MRSEDPNRKFTLGLITEWRRLELPFDGAAMLIAVSGGADSCALAYGIADLSVRRKLRNRFTVAHFDHGLRGEQSLEDAEFVSELASSLGFEYVQGSADKKSYSGSNIEQEARNARYSFLHSAACEIGANYVLTAHTVNDQAETLLLNLIRGAGAEGLGAMEPVSSLDDIADIEAVPGESAAVAEEGVHLVRPLLRWAKRELVEAYARSLGIECREDPMNTDPSFSRVRVRRELIPLLETFNPKIVDTLARTAGHLSVAAEAGNGNRNPGRYLSVSLLAAMNEPERNREIREWLRDARGDLRSIGTVHIEAVSNLATSRKSGRCAELPGGTRVVKGGGKLVLEDSKVEN